jgi:thiamine pyrophosphate-dependent acetolactate synthase large subunit-like protein
MPLFYIDADARYRADSYTALKQINSHTTGMQMDVATRSARISALESEHRMRMTQIESLAVPREDGLLSCSHLIRAVREAIPKDSVIILEAVTQTVTVVDQLMRSEPKSIFNSGAGGRSFPLSLLQLNVANGFYKSAGSAEQPSVQN